MKVGTKDLKNRLSHYLRRVREGEVVLITDGGRIVAEMRAVASPEAEDDVALTELDAAGILTVGSGRYGRVQGVRLRGVRASRAVLEDRG